MLPTSLGHCLDTLSNYGPGREPCSDKVFSPGPGVLSGFVFLRSSPGDTTLSEPRDSSVVSLRLARTTYDHYNWSTIGLRGDEKEDGLGKAIALGDGRQVRAVLTEAEGARVLEEGVVLLGVQATVQGIMLQQGVWGTDRAAAIERVQG
jgi:hypothetical protein